MDIHSLAVVHLPRLPRPGHFGAQDEHDYYLRHAPDAHGRRLPLGPVAAVLALSVVIVDVGRAWL
jgi:hypothetical protein